MAETEAPASRVASLPASAFNHPAMMIASTGAVELGVYVKWALLLQEQLEAVQAERVAVLQRCLKLQADNQLLRQTLQEENPTKYAHLAPPNAQPSQVVSAQASRDASKRGSAPPQISAPVEVPPLPTTSGSQALAAAAAATKGSVLVDQDVLNTPNLRLLASFLKDDERGGEARQSAHMSTRRRATNDEGLDLPPLTADGQPAAKMQRRSQSGRTISSFNALAAASARKAR